MNRASLRMCPHSVILRFGVVTPLGVSTPFSQVSLPWDVSGFLGDPGALVQAGFPPQAVSSA